MLDVVFGGSLGGTEYCWATLGTCCLCECPGDIEIPCPIGPDITSGDDAAGEAGEFSSKVYREPECPPTLDK